MKTEPQYFIAAINTITKEYLVTSPFYANRTALERLYGAWCIRMMLDSPRVLECLETVEFEIKETIE